MSLPFSDFYDVFGDEIRATAHSQTIPGMDYDDVVSEMLICLWKAANTYEYTNEGTTFASYWWSLWLNRKYTLTRDYGREKRIQPILVEDTQSLDKTVTDHSLPQAPNDDEQERLIWNLLSVGCNATEVQREAEISRRTYYRIIQSWKTETVRNQLI